MKLKSLSIYTLGILLGSTTAIAQISPDLVAAAGIPAGNAFAPHTPSGTVIIGNQLWVGDEAQGLRHYIPVDPSNNDPLNSGNLKFDTDPSWSVGGGSCLIWCSVGQVAQDGSTRSYAAVWDHAKGQPGNPGGPGVWMILFQPVFGAFSPIASISPVAPSFGLGGDQPTAVALGPDGKLYVGFLKSGNIKRIVNPSILNPTPQTQTVESVGSTPSGRPMRSMAFLGADLYIATDQGLSVIRNSAACVGNQGGCGNAVLIQDGHAGAAHVALTTDSAGKVYFSVGATVYRYTPLDGRVVPISSGFAFVGGHTNMLTLDSFGNLWVGDDTTDGAANFTGRLWRVPAASLASIL